MTKSNGITGTIKGSGLIGLSPLPAAASTLSNPLEIPGFLAQLRNSTSYNNDFKQLFSIYLSNDPKVKGKITFGGYDLKSFAKGPKPQDSDVSWLAQAPNLNYWATNCKSVKFGDTTITSNHQYTILDNGSSFAMAPKRDFDVLIKLLADKYGVLCRKDAFAWSCGIPDE